MLTVSKVSYEEAKRLRAVERRNFTNAQAIPVSGLLHQRIFYLTIDWIHRGGGRKRERVRKESIKGIIPALFWCNLFQRLTFSLPPPRTKRIRLQGCWGFVCVLMFCKKNICTLVAKQARTMRSAVTLVKVWGLRLWARKEGVRRPIIFDGSSVLDWHLVNYYTALLLSM